MEKTDYEIEAINREVENENRRHRDKLEQLRQRKQYLKDSRVKKREQEKRQKSYKECVYGLSIILQN